MPAKDIDLLINDLTVHASFYEENEEEIFLPLLRQVDGLQKKKQKRLIVLLAGPGGAGKSTLAAYLETLAGQAEDIQPVQAVGMDGFHYPNQYLNNHHLNDDSARPLLQTVKGAPSTFDVAKLTTYIQKAQNENIIWPGYSRLSHDVSEEGTLLTSNIIIIEGLYLLLDQPEWNQLASLADYTIFIEADISQIRQHIIERKMKGGYSYQQAYDHFENSDKLNAGLILQNQLKADLLLSVDNQMKYHLKNEKDY